MADIKSYKILNLDDQERVVQLVSIPSFLIHPLTGKKVRPPRPRVAVVGKNEFIILTISSEDSGSLGVIVGLDGEARRGTLQFSEYPRSILYDDPYILALFSDGRIEFHNTLTHEIVSHNFVVPENKKPRMLAYVSSIPVISMKEELVNAEFSMVDFDSNFKQQYAKSSYHSRQKEEMNFSNICNKFNANITILYNDSVKILIRPSKFIEICRLLDEKRIEEAIDEIERSLPNHTSDFTTPPEIKYLYQRVSLVFLESLLFDDALEYLKKGSLDPRALLSLYNQLYPYLKTVIESLDGLPLTRDVRILIKNMHDINTLVRNGSNQFTGGNSEIAAELELSLLQNANDLLCRFLEYCKKIYSSYEILIPINTALAMLYSNTKEIKKFTVLLFEQSSSIDSDILIKYLESKNHLYFASLVYKSYEVPEKVLDIWEEILKSKDTESGFDGDEEYLEYITELKNEELTSRRFYKVLDFKPSLAVKMFYKLSPGTVAGLNTDLLIAKFEAIGDDKVLGDFIERLVEVHHSKSPIYSTLLIQIRIRDIGRWFFKSKGILEEGRALRSELENAYRIRQNRDIHLTFRDFLVGMIGLINEIQNNGKKVDQGGIVSGKSIDFSNSINFNSQKNELYDECLRSKMSKGYTTSLRLRYNLLELMLDPQQLFDTNLVFETIKVHAPNYLYLEMAIILARVGNIKDAVNILVHSAQDFGEAELICFGSNQSLSLSRLTPLSIETSRKRLSATKKPGPVSEGGKKPDFLNSESVAKSMIEEGLINQFPDTLQPELNIIGDNLKYRIFFEYLSLQDSELGYSLILGLVTRSDFNYDYRIILNNVPISWEASPFVSYFKTILEANLNKTNASKLSLILLSKSIQTLRSEKYYTTQFPELAPTFLKRNFGKTGAMFPINSIINDINSYFILSPDIKNPEKPIVKKTAFNGNKYDIESELKGKTHVTIRESDICENCGIAIGCDRPFLFMPSTKKIYHQNCAKESSKQT
ncbi:Vacuolar protein sorting-associated protein 3 [Smittium mucronatum]|uniref:Vacuolar protein sorting-associated protein 3 n=1 Tax=Smittium mucronatum TaxID=133383 RepID=A0A1R0H5Q5_9FUNG|nr:Vacuolar protein sorting-associated protein 3 [Smittium mucronatum]